MIYISCRRCINCTLYGFSYLFLVPCNIFIFVCLDANDVRIICATTFTRFSCCILVYYICERFTRILANLPAGLEDLISSYADRNTCNPVTKKAFLIMHPTQLFLVIVRERKREDERRREREKEGKRAFSIIRCNQPFLVMQKARLDYAS